MSKIIIIPARYQSARFPGKIIHPIHGKAMIQWVFERCKASEAEKVIIAVDHPKVLKVCKDFCENVIMTSPNHKSGTSRCLEVAQQLLDVDYIMNVQADEPMIDPILINQLFDFIQEKSAEIATLVKSIDDITSIQNPNIVKCVMTHDKKALYFSRAQIPFPRDTLMSSYYYKHIGVYAFKKSALLATGNMQDSSLEQIEKLEQLKWLQAGKKIFCLETDYDSYGVDTPGDLQHVSELLLSK